MSSGMVLGTQVQMAHKGQAAETTEGRRGTEAGTGSCGDEGSLPYLGWSG